MHQLDAEGVTPRPWPRRRMWPWWSLLAVAVGAILAVPSFRAALSGGAADEPGSAAYAAPAAQDHASVQFVAAKAPALDPTKLAEGYTIAAGGPLGPADREFLVKVRQAGLWEAPAGTLAQTHSNDEKVKEVGRQLAADHHGLDTQVRQISAQLGVPLPNEASAEQQGWIAEMTPKSGADFDLTFANRLRAAHGKVFALVSQIRSGTRNDLVRGFAQTAINVVMKHMTLLESIGNVDYGALPEPVLPSAAAKSPSAAAAFQPDAVWAVAGVALLVGAIAAFRIHRSSRRPRRSPAY